QSGRSLHGVLLPDRVTQREKWIKHDLVEKRVASPGRIFQAGVVLAEPNPQPDEHPDKDQDKGDCACRFGSEKFGKLGPARDATELAENTRTPSDGSCAEHYKLYNRISCPN